MNSILGTIGALCFSICAIPQAWTCYKTKSAKGVSTLFLALWCIGEACMLAYVMSTTMDPYLITNYVMNGVCLAVIAYYKIVEV